MKTATVELTEEEVMLLAAAFEVLVAGGGIYTMLSFTADIHRELLRKFDDARQAMEQR
jgi:hypothetical protein